MARNYYSHWWMQPCACHPIGDTGRFYPLDNKRANTVRQLVYYQANSFTFNVAGSQRASERRGGGGVEGQIMRMNYVKVMVSDWSYLIRHHHHHHHHHRPAVLGTWERSDCITLIIMHLLALFLSHLWKKNLGKKSSLCWSKRSVTQQLSQQREGGQARIRGVCQDSLHIKSEFKDPNAWLDG